VEECAVVGIPDKEWGERVVAVIIPRGDLAISVQDAKAFLKARLSPFKVPKEYFLVKEMPKSAAGKVLKRELTKSLINKGRI
jgi:long-chain acyl-CoA synthetase